MPRAIQTPLQIKDRAIRRRQKKEQRQHDTAVDAEKARLEFYGDLRDDVMSLVRNSHLTPEEIHGRCGPHPVTLRKWDEKKVGAPQLAKLQSVLRIMGYDIGIIEGTRRPMITPLAAE